jgi:hypothetical protein
MLNNMVASFAASNQIGEQIKNQKKKVKGSENKSSLDYNPSDTSDSK